MGAGHSGMEIGGSCMGYQVLRVYPDSPGSRAGLKAYFDFIIAIGNTRFNKENGSLREILKASVDQKLKMIVLNTRTRSTREVEIVPSTSWGGNGLLGVSIKHSSFDRADDRVWHVVEVEPGSPAYQAGFIAGKDYIIGSDSILQENDDLYNLVETHEGKALKLFVYNVETDNCREVVCHPNSKWGGKGYLGCEFGHGLLHRIPFNDAGDLSSMNESSRAPLLRNEQASATSQHLHIQNASNNNNSNSFQNQLMKQQLQHLQNPMQPGFQSFQEALLDRPPANPLVPPQQVPSQQAPQQTLQQMQQTQQQTPHLQNPMQPGYQSFQEALLNLPPANQLAPSQQAPQQTLQQTQQQPQHLQNPMQPGYQSFQGALSDFPPAKPEQMQQQQQHLQQQLLQQQQQNQPHQQQQQQNQPPQQQQLQQQQQQQHQQQQSQPHQQQQQQSQPHQQQQQNQPHQQQQYMQQHQLQQQHPHYQQQLQPQQQQANLYEQHEFQAPTIHHQQSPPEPPKFSAEMVLPPPPPQLPQTFAQLASFHQPLANDANH